MSPETWRRVKVLVAECLEMEKEERTAHLNRVCGEDSELRAEAESLLAFHAEAGEFLEKPAVSLPDGGMRLGPWQLEAEVGHGGMGRIYRASRADGLYEQNAAVKVLRRGMDTDLILRHFQAERQILASLNHPNVARLLDGGVTPDGRPFFVMEFIEGRPLDRYVEDRKPSIGERLRLFQLVCGAVQYAHQRLVVHRDIKPANILVTEDGVPKLVDFGIAKLVNDGNDVTVVSERMLTPAYASPEQLEGEAVTTASDIYSLGVVLYQLLAGQAPFSPGERDRSGEPVVPSTAAGETRAPTGEPLREVLRGDLDNIVLKAMERDPGKRYGSAKEFSDDIQRYLEGRPVAARKPTFSYRAARFVRRNRLLVAAGVVVALALAGGFATTFWQYRQAQAERRQAQQRFDKLRKLANSVINEFHDSIVDVPGTTAARALMLTRALEYLDGLAAEAGDDVALRIELAAAYRRVGDVQGQAGGANLGNRKAAEVSYAKAISTLEEVKGKAAESNQVRAALAKALINSGGDEHTLRAIDLAAGQPELLADAYYARADVLTERGDYEGSLAMRQQDLAIRQQLLAANPGDRRLRGNVALVAKRMGGLLIRLGRLDEAYTKYAAAMELEKKILAEEPLSLGARTAISYSISDIAYIRIQQGRLAEALEGYREVVALREDLFKKDEKNFRARAGLASACWRTADLLIRMGRTAQAILLLDRAMDLMMGGGASVMESFSEKGDLGQLRRVSGQARLTIGQRAEGIALLEQARQDFLALQKRAPGRKEISEQVEEIRKALEAARK
ncbi:MAG: protein kinase [Acidobacteria bacterium]|nr:protein kinase [Acidobacteriota bacterium]